MLIRAQALEESPRKSRTYRLLRKILAIFSGVLHPWRTKNEVLAKLELQLRPHMPKENYDEAMRLAKLRINIWLAFTLAGYALISVFTLYFAPGILVLNANEIHMSHAAPRVGLVTFVVIGVCRRIALDPLTARFAHQLRESEVVHSLLESRPLISRLTSEHGKKALWPFFLVLLGNAQIMTALLALGANARVVMSYKLLVTVLYVNIFYHTGQTIITFFGGIL